MLEETGCDAVMIGRGVLGNPWLIKECVDYLEHNIEPQKISNEEKINMMKRHFEMLKQDKSLKAALLEIRSNILFYLKGMPNGKEIKKKICETKTEEEIYAVLDEYLAYLKQTQES